jgi:uncharacterized protein (DUF58 family)
MAQPPRFLDPHTLSRISPMELRARAVVEGFIAGLHRSPFRGFSVEFAEYRQYSPGDDIRHIDWKAFARTDRYYVKEYEDETNLHAFILLDHSASMGYRSGTLSKLEYASYLAASLAYFVARQRDGVGLITFDQQVNTVLPARSKSAHIYAMLDHLENLSVGQATDMGKPLHELAESINRRGLVILISDLIDDPARTMESLQHFRFKGHDVIVFHIVDPDELHFPFTDTARFEDPETGDRMVVVPTVAREQYLQAVQAFMKETRTGCIKNQVDYTRLVTDQPLDYALFAYLGKRMRSFV